MSGALQFHSFIHQWLYSPLLGPGLFFTFVIFFTQTVGLLGQEISSSQGRYLHTLQHKHRINEHTDIHALRGIRTHDPSFRARKRLFLIPNIFCCTQSCWVFLTFPSTGVLENRKHDVSESGSVSVLKWGGQDTYSVKTCTQLGLLERANLSRWTE
jgi:hypothetical protein